MKIAFSAWVLCIFAASSLWSQVPSVKAIERSRGPHHKVWNAIHQRVAPNGVTYVRTNTYVELATGLHHWKNNQWVETQEAIRIQEGAAVADEGPHKVIFAANLNSVGAIDMETPDGKRFRSHVLGLAYTDSVTGATVMIAEVKDSIGGVLDPNQVIYQDAFEGDVVADVRYTYTKGGFEQDIVVLTAPPNPSAYGDEFDSATTRLEVWTEFIEIPAGQSTTRVLKGIENPAIRAQMFEPDLVDERLDFGVMKFEAGHAFPVGERNESYVPTGKRLERIDGRVFLIEKVDYRDIASYLDTLPVAQANGNRPKWLPEGDARLLAAHLPKAPTGVRGAWKERQFAALDADRHGFVLDYVTVNGSLTNFTFAGDSTYYLSGNLYLYEDTVFEGGTVLKYGSGASAILYGPADFQTQAWHPAIFTAKDDDSVGQSISGSSGTPSGTYATSALSFQDTTDPYDVHDIRVRHALAALVNANVQVNVRHAQIGPGTRAHASLSGGAIDYSNVLFHNLSYAFLGLSTITNTVQHGTFHQLPSLNFSVASPPPYVTNSLIVSVTNYTQFTGGSDVVVTNDDTGIFQAVGAGHRYLAANSPYRDGGTTNITSTLLSDLRERTTRPPIIISNTIDSATVLAPTVPRDEGLPDLGYHYDPIDFVANDVIVTNTTLLLTNGVVFAAYGDNGFFLHGGDGLFASQGTALNPNRLLRYTSVQESSVVWGSDISWAKLFVNNYNFSASPPSARIRFTESYLRGPEEFQIYNNDSSGFSYSDVEIKDSLLLGGGLLFVGATDATLALTNNTFYRTGNFEVTGGGTLASLNNLFRRVNGNYLYQDPTNNTWTFSDNLLDECTNWVNASDQMVRENNAYFSSTDFYSYFTTNASELVLSSVTYEEGDLGNYYQPTNSTLLNAGSRNADLAGLFHYTATTDQVKETNSVVDIGVHYVAVDGGGVPFDEDGDGLADYFEDLDGDGVGDSGETDWEDADTDGDGVSDFLEYVQGRNPLAGALADTNNLTRLEVYTPLK